MGRTIDLTGKQYNALLVIARDLSPREDKNSYWICECTCGCTVSVRGAHLKDGGVPSCGCKRSEKASIQNTCHGLTGHRILDVHSNMKKRCLDTSHKDYPSYGGRGIQICQRWLKASPQGVMNLLEDMGDPPEGMSLDRIDNDGDYEPSNCQWTDRNTQNRNQRKKPGTSSKYKGVSWNKKMKKWAAGISIENNRKHLGYFYQEDDAGRAYNNALKSFKVHGVFNDIGRDVDD